MENPSIVRNGGIKLPIGYRFRPTDEELIVHYLTRKVQSIPFPAQVIPELNVFQTNPLHLPGDSTEKRFFFWKRKGKWKKTRGMTESGYWKPMGKEKHVVSYESNRAIGVKKSYVFYEGGKRPRGLRTQWVMREYRLLGSQTRPNSGLQKFVREMEDWVVCKIYQKKRTSKKNVVETDMNSSKSNKIWSAREISPIVMDVVMVGSNDDLGPPQPSSSSCSSGVSFCKGEPPEEEITSAYNISSFFA
ncbi:NAC domain-containing protein 83-like [Rhododendron vialii]|uniref:NAC domain-containing protein 83-like n=1 Tax=Rhododendron vialii TaxID=182163 RepID=UPI00265E09FC|nr:NAC domain-containing protein 83-like [Rhododendron vialii]